MDILVKAVGFAQKKSPSQEKQGGRIISTDSIHILVSGKGTFQDFQTPPTRIKAGAIFLLFAGKWHHFDPDPGTIWDERWALFDGLSARKHFGSIVHRNKSVYHFEPDSILEESHEDLNRAWFYGGLESENTINYLLHKFMFEVHAKIMGLDYPVRRAEDSLVFRARTHMRFWVTRVNNWDAEDFAKQMGISYEQFRKRFKRETGYSPGKYFSTLKANRARELLIRTSQTIKEIAYALAFNDEYYFSRWFKKQEGVSPRDYRNQHVKFTTLNNDKNSHIPFVNKNN